jgi:hypothetical protein
VNAAEVVAALVEGRVLSPDLAAIVAVQSFAAALDGLDEVHPDMVRSELADIARVLLGDPGAHTRPGPQGWVVYSGWGRRMLETTRGGWMEQAGGATEGDAWLAVLRWRLP